MPRASFCEAASFRDKAARTQTGEFCRVETLLGSQMRCRTTSQIPEGDLHQYAVTEFARSIVSDIVFASGSFEKKPRVRSLAHESHESPGLARTTHVRAKLLVGQRDADTAKAERQGGDERARGRSVHSFAVAGRQVADSLPTLRKYGTQAKACIAGTRGPRLPCLALSHVCLMAQAGGSADRHM